MENVRINFLLLAKVYKSYAYQMRVWFEYHASRFPNSVFTVLNNDSEADMKRILDSSMPRYRYNLINIHGFPDQTRLYGEILNSEKYKYCFKENDFVAVIDDDEYLYLGDPDLPSYINLDVNTFFLKAFENIEVVAIPEILMSTPTLYDELPRNKALPLVSTYRKAETTSQVKCIIRYNSQKKYEFKTDDEDHTWHIPSIDGVKANAYLVDAWLGDKKEIELYCTPLNGKGFANVNPKSHFNIYHYHIKSAKDWKEKIKRGSSASKTPWYSEDITKNPFFYNYNILDNTMANELTRVISDQRFSWFGDFVIQSESDGENKTIVEKEKWEKSKALSCDIDAPTYDDFRFAKNQEEKINLAKKWIQIKAPHVQLNGKNIVNLINYYKLYDSDPKKSLWADKIAVRQELYDLGLNDIIIPSIFEKYKPTKQELEEILSVSSRYDSIVKCNHGSGWNIKFTPYGEKIDFDYLINRFNGWLSTNYAYIAGYEHHYEAITPGILVQPNLFPKSSTNPTDYQFYCVNGEIIAVDLQIKASKIFIKHLAFLAKDGSRLPWYIGSTPSCYEFTNEQKAAIDSMIPYVEEISSHFKFVRVDMLYSDSEKKPYFCEATFVPCSGILDYIVNDFNSSECPDFSNLINK